MVHQVVLFPTLRRLDPDLVAGAQGQRLAEQSPARDLVGQQNELRRRFVVVELRHEGFEHFFHGERFVSAREISAVAPIVAGAEEEYLDRGLPGLLVGGAALKKNQSMQVYALVQL